MKRLVEDFKEVFSHLQKVTKVEGRPWSEFIGKFQLPKKSRYHIENRVLINLYYYRVNYWLLTSGLVFCSILFNPVMLVVASTVGCLSLYLFVMIRKPVVIQGKLLTQREKGLLLSFVALFLMVSTNTLVLSIALVAIIATTVLVHATLRPRSVRSKFSKFGGVAALGAKGVLEENAREKMESALEGGYGGSYNHTGGEQGYMRTRNPTIVPMTHSADTFKFKPDYHQPIRDSRGALSPHNGKNI